MNSKETISLVSWNPVQSAFQSIWAQFMADPDLMDAYRVEDSRNGEDTVIAALYLISESMQGNSDSGDLEAAFWRDALP